MRKDQYTNTSKMGSAPTKEQAGKSEWEDNEHRMGVSRFESINV